jgi:hypothetical protein
MVRRCLLAVSGNTPLHGSGFSYRNGRFPLRNDRYRKSQRVRINNFQKAAVLPGGGFFFLMPGQCDGENVKRLQPVAFRNVSAHSSSVAPVVSTSSMMMTLS